MSAEAKTLYTPFILNCPPVDKLPKVKIADRLSGWVDASEEQERFHFMKDGESGEMYRRRIFDNNRAHIYRGCMMVALLDLPQKDLATMSLMFQLHDLPELGKPKIDGVRRDMTTTDKLRFPHLAKLDEEAEINWAREHFTPSDLALYLRYENVKPVLSGAREESSVEPLQGPEVLVKIIDAVDGDNCLHYFASEFVREHGFKAWNGCSDASFDNYDRRGKQYSANLRGLSLDDRYKEIGLELFRQMDLYVRDCWEDIDLTDAPETLKRPLDA